MALPAGPEYGAKYTLTGPDGTIAVFNDSTSPNFVGSLSPESSGLDSAEVRESAVDAVEEDGGVHGNFYYGRRPVVLQGSISATSAEDRNKKALKIMAASNAMRGNATLKWTPVGGEELELKLRRQQPVRFTKGFVKEFQIPLVSSDAVIKSVVSKVSFKEHTAEQSSGTFVSGKTTAGAKEWSNPGNILSINETFAAIELNTEGQLSQYLIGLGPGLTLPTNANITGYTLELFRGAGLSGLNGIKVNEIWLMSNEVKVGASKAGTENWGNAKFIAEIFGSINDKWGTTLIPSNVNAKFGFEVRVKNNAPETSLGRVDGAVVRVWYVAPFILKNEGNASVYPVVTITGPAKNVTLENVSTSAKLVWNSELKTGDSLVIDFNARTVLKNGVNAYNNISFTESAWWVLNPGENEISWRAEALHETNTTVTFKYKSAWI